MNLAETLKLGAAAERGMAVRFCVGLVLALAVHVGVGLLAWANPPAPTPRASNLLETEIELPMHAPVLAKPVVQAEASVANMQPVRRAHAARELRARTTQVPSALAPAAAVVGQPASPSAPLDFSADVFVTGSATAYAGASTTANGTSRNSATAAATGVRGDGLGAGKPGLAAPVTLLSDEWRCAWPHEADRAEVDAQTVTLRVLVGPDGHAQRVTLIDDPGYGFAAAARACAMQTHFEPARDELGTHVLALSPRIRVRFTR